jgi:hypothetical protein
MLIGPVVAPLGTDVLIVVSPLTVNAAVVPLKLTAVVPVNPVPVMVTAVPTDPLEGLTVLMAGFGAGLTVNVAEDAGPPGVVMLIGPVVAPLGTDVLIVVSPLTVNAAVVPLKLTAVVPVNPVPVMVTAVPTEPLDGLTLLMAGGDAVPVLKVAMVPVHALDVFKVAP